MKDLVSKTGLSDVIGNVVDKRVFPSDRLQNYFDEIEEKFNDTNFTVATLPDPTKNEGRQIYVSDEVGGATLAFSDGVNWRRVQDRAIVS